MDSTVRPRDMTPPPDASRPQPVLHADLHTHTDRSDGRLSPAQLVQRAVERRLRVLAVTDHDTVEGVDAAVAAAEPHDLTVLAGAELSVSLDDAELHLLAYGFDSGHDGLGERLGAMQEARRHRAWEMVDRLRKQGLEVEDAALRQQLSTTTAPGRPHVAAALVRSGHVDTLDDAFDRYLGRDGPGFVAQPAFPADEALSLIHDAGGIGVLAHPGHWTPTLHVRRLVAAGLDGIEVYHPSHGSSLRTYYRRMARSYDLLVTGGSDFHGHTAREETRLGEIGLNVSRWERLRTSLT